MIGDEGMTKAPCNKYFHRIVPQQFLIYDKIFGIKILNVCLDQSIFIFYHSPNSPTHHEFFHLSQ